MEVLLVENLRAPKATKVTHKKRPGKNMGSQTGSEQKIILNRKNVRKIITNLILESAVILPLSGLLRVVESKNNQLFIYFDRTLL
jgi:hypothetical protein